MGRKQAGENRGEDGSLLPVLPGVGIFSLVNCEIQDCGFQISQDLGSTILELMRFCEIGMLSSLITQYLMRFGHGSHHIL